MMWWIEISFPDVEDPGMLNAGGMLGTRAIRMNAPHRMEFRLQSCSVYQKGLEWQGEKEA